MRRAFHIQLTTVDRAMLVRCGSCSQVWYQERAGCPHCGAVDGHGLDEECEECGSLLDLEHDRAWTECADCGRMHRSRR